MLGLMQDYPLLTHTILDHAALNHGEREQVTRSIEGPIRRTTLADIRTRALTLSTALENEGGKRGGRTEGVGSRVDTPSYRSVRALAWADAAFSRLWPKSIVLYGRKNGQVAG